MPVIGGGLLGGTARLERAEDALRGALGRLEPSGWTHIGRLARSAVDSVREISLRARTPRATLSAAMLRDVDDKVARVVGALLQARRLRDARNIAGLKRRFDSELRAYRSAGYRIRRTMSPSRPMQMRRSVTMLRGFGDTEEIVEETVTETVGPAGNQGLKTAVAFGSVALIGAGLWFGMTKKTATGARRYRWAV